MIDNAVLQCEQLSIEARGAYAYCFSLPEDWEFSIFRVAKSFKCGVEKATRIINELIEFGLLEKEVWHTEKGYKKVSYVLYDMGTRNENANKENPYKENPYKENHNNNKIINNTKKESHKESILQTPYNPPKENTLDLKAIKEGFERVRELYKTIKPAKSDLIFQRAEQEFFKIVRSGEIDCEGIIKAMEQQVEVWRLKLKDNAENIQFIPRLENWLERKTYLEDFDTHLLAIKQKSATLQRGSQDWGSKDTPNGKLSDLLGL